MALRSTAISEDVRTSRVLTYPATLMVWLKWNSNSATNQPWMRVECSTAGIYGTTNAAGTNYRILDFGGTPSSDGSAVAYDGTWAHLTLVVRTGTSNNLALYHNGTLDITHTYASGNPANTDIRVGCPTALYVRNGWAAHWKVWSGVELTADEIKQEMWSARPVTQLSSLDLWCPLATGNTDLSPNRLSMTTTGTVEWEDGPPVGWGAPPLKLNTSTIEWGGAYTADVNDSAPAGVNDRITFNLPTITGTDTAAVIMVSENSAADTTITSATLGGTSITAYKVVDYRVGDYTKLWAFVVPNPTSGAEFILVTSETNRKYGIATYFTGVHQTTPNRTASTAGDTYPATVTASVTDANGQSGDVIVGVFGCNDLDVANGFTSARCGNNYIYSEDDNNEAQGAMSFWRTAGATLTWGRADGMDNTWAAAAIPLVPAAATGTPGTVTVESPMTAAAAVLVAGVTGRWVEAGQIWPTLRTYT